MKAIILAAGYGTRMYPLTLNTAKGLLDINGKPVMDYLMENLIQAEPSTVCVVCNDKFYKDYIEWAKKWSDKVKIKLVNDGSVSDETKLGALKDLSLGWNELVPKKSYSREEVIILASDNLLGFSLKEFSRTSPKETLVAVHDLVDLEEAKKHGIVELKANRIINLEEKPISPKSTLASICCYKFTSNTKNTLEKYLREGNKDNTGNFIKYLLGKEIVNAFLFKEKIYDIGSIQSYEKAVKELI